MEDLPNIVDITVLSNHRLMVTFDNGVDGVADFTGLIAAFPPFAPLIDPTEFAKVSICAFGSGIAWDCGLDISADRLLQLKCDQTDWTGADVAAWQSRLHLSNQEAADLLGVSLATMKNYRLSDRRTPGSIKIACQALERDQGLFQALYRPRIIGRPKLQAQPSHVPI